MGCFQSTAQQQPQPKPQQPQQQQQQQLEEANFNPAMVKWTELGGDQLEEPLREGWVKLVRASWLVELSESGGKLSRRQDLPSEAFVSLDELKAAGPFDQHYSITGMKWLRIIVVSYPWLQPGHPDPHGENLRVIAKALEAYQSWGGLHGVLIDFAALYQVERTAEEYAVFKLALGALHLFYSHENTVVFKVTKFPPGYPNNPLFRYVLPDGANTVEYMRRGWCATESAVSGLVKSSDKVVDLGLLENQMLEDQMDVFSLVERCRVGRAPPLHPEDFNAALGEKTFTNKKDDFDKVASLYSAAFHRLLGSAQKLDYHSLQWGPNEVRQLLKAFRGNSTLQELNLSKNEMGPEGAVALAEALRGNSTLQALNLSENEMGPEGAVALAEALRVNNALQTLNLHFNSVGPEGTAALAEALCVNSALQTLNLEGNSVGQQGAAALAKALRENRFLTTLSLYSNLITDQGKALLHEACRDKAEFQLELDV